VALSFRDRWWKLGYFVYYGALYDRALPGVGWLRRGVRGFEARTGRGDAPQAAADWQRQWTAGRWDFLADRGETERHEVLVEVLQRLGPEARILDVGCGDGVLYAALCRAPIPPGDYHGIDIAANAIERARALAASDASARFEVADAATFVPARRYDAVVFNESLYYLDEPEATAERYRAQALEPAGWLIVSLFRSRRSEAIRRALRRRFEILDGRAVVHGERSWSVTVFAASPSATRTASDRSSAAQRSM
jgi:2-polyprenyl-3-methyl-5-hydroxy-6-metoxy-1,4-benzoquinol methylase